MQKAAGNWRNLGVSAICNRSEVAGTFRHEAYRARGRFAWGPYQSVQNCTDSLTSACHHSSMVETSFYRLKAERCSQMAKVEADPCRRSELETESRLWLQIAVTEDDLEGLRKKAQNLLNAQAIQKAGSSRKG